MLKKGINNPENKFNNVGKIIPGDAYQEKN